MHVMGNGGNFLERSGNQEDIEMGNEERGKAYSSCFPENIRCMYVPVSWQVGSIAEGQMSFVGAEGWSGGSPQTPQTAKPVTVLCYSGWHQELAEEMHCLNPTASWPKPSIPLEK